MAKTYKKGGYSVTIDDDGAIKVKRGDTVSKYSMAIHGDFKHLDEFHRKVGNKLKPLANINLIHAGETLYHVPSSPDAKWEVAKKFLIRGEAGPLPQIAPKSPRVLSFGSKGANSMKVSVEIDLNFQSLAKAAAEGTQFPVMTIAGYARNGTLPLTKVQMTEVVIVSISITGTAVDLTLSFSKLKLSLGR